MDKNLRTKLIFHGAILVLLGLLAGFPYAMVLLGSLEGSERAWRMAHLEGLLNGLVLFAVAGIYRRLSLDDRQRTIMSWSLIITGYCNLVASVIGAATGNRGLAVEPPFANIVVALLFIIAVVTVFIGFGLIAYGARPSVAAEGQRVHVEVSTSPAPESEPDEAGGGKRSSSRGERRRKRRR